MLYIAYKLRIFGLAIQCRISEIMNKRASSQVFLASRYCELVFPELLKQFLIVLDTIYLIINSY